ncbi:MAG TPA: hypothetical protein VGK18_03365, partial [Propionicimonas sp.]|uniref:hypothetical protein n=1 Tax=Propionicimonas sp. TaxID=1955623 RepID=UPI002F40CAA6
HHPDWAAYLTARAGLVEHLAEQIHTTPPDQRPAWHVATRAPVPDQLTADLQVWRAANNIPDHDLRPTGTPPTSAAAARWQHRLESRLAEAGMPDITPWWSQLKNIAPHLAADPDLPMLATHLSDIAGLGMDAHHVLDAALHDGPLPVHGLAAALTWRLERHEYIPRGWPPEPRRTGPRPPHPSAPSHRPDRNRGISI